MKLIVLGATGGIGLETVRQAIEDGHSVTAFVRSPERLKPFGNRITVKQGDLLNSIELAKAISGHDAILSGFGPRVPVSKADANLLRDFATTLTTAMQHADIRRAVIVSTAFLFKDSIVPPTYLLGRLFFPGVVIDATAMEQIIAESGLDWTIVRPPQLTDKPLTGKYRVQTGHLPRFGFKISRADVARCLIETADDRASIGKILGLSN
ncbi:MAG: SDR family oxidoreductase [Edaphobacter sp.]|uniref:NAD(P)-dependent oxidoreductase n=1 Tax=Edaphobacter sp. TaxID=1934404 RepID=UPI00239095DD|nr:SDR family oxidoreductase [Edaphobacter sp.]MDE1177432.1 SDR family oxidoreductase [Edaphobacter sp.]